MNIYVEKGAYVPERAHKTDAGLDVRSSETRLIKAQRDFVAYWITCAVATWNGRTVGF